MQVVLITGCSSGIGRALAWEFNRAGYRVCATARKLEDLKELEAGGVKLYQLDVTDDDSILNAVEQVLSVESHIDILVNNAGYAAISPVIDFSRDALQRQFDTNVFGALVLTRRVAESMIEHREGMIINVGSVSGIFVTPFAGAYCASKAALHAFSDALRMELAPFGVKVIQVQPGGIQSRFGEASLRVLEKIFSSDSRYASMLEVMKQRATMSQQGAASPEDLARYIIKKIRKPSPPPVMRFGAKSFLMPFMSRWFPSAMRDGILMKKFRMEEL